jgi:hypothetical protein
MIEIEPGGDDRGNVRQSLIQDYTMTVYLDASLCKCWGNT